MIESSSLRSGLEGGESFGARRSARESLIDAECFFEGTFRTPGNLRIEGGCQGVIECQGTLFIAESGHVNARILAGNLTVAGQLEGEAQCGTRFEMLKTGHVNGSVAASSVVIHDGAYFTGDIRMGGAARSEDNAAPATPATATVAAPARTGEPVSGVAATVPVRRRPAAENPPPLVTEPTAEAVEAPAAKMNGRGQGSGSRDIQPNRAADSV